MNLAAFLVAMVGPMVARVLASLGLTMVTLAGGTAALAALKDLLVSQLGALPAGLLQLMGLMGVWAALGIIFGAMTFCITWRATSGFWQLAKK